VDSTGIHWNPLESTGIQLELVGDMKDLAITTDCEDTHERMLRLFAQMPTTYFRLNVEQGMQGMTTI